MAKIKSSIFATTALVAFAGAAAADVAVTGNAEMGIAGGSGTTQTTFFQSVDIRFSASGTSDNGLSFGAVVDLDDASDRAGTAGIGDIAGAFADFNVFVAGDFGRLTMGDTDGAFDWAMQEVDFNGAGSIGDNHTGHRGFSGNAGLDGFYNGQVLRYEYAIAGFGVAVSAEVDSGAGTARPGLGAPAIPASATTGDAILGLGLRYGGDFGGGSYSFGLGYQGSEDLYGAAAGDQGVSITGLSAAIALSSGLSISANVSQIKVDGANNDGQHSAIGVSYAFDAVTLHANYGEFDWDVGATAADTDGYGLSASYDLGGGLLVQAGYGFSDTTALNGSAAGNYVAGAFPAIGDASTWSLGLRMNF